MLRNLSIVLGIGLAACMSKSPPTTNPSEMTAQQHVQKCEKHERRAETAEKRADEAAKAEGGEGSYRGDYVAQLERDRAAQHGDAAKAVDPAAPECPDTPAAPPK